MRRRPQLGQRGGRAGRRVWQCRQVTDFTGLVPLQPGGVVEDELLIALLIEAHFNHQLPGFFQQGEEFPVAALRKKHGAGVVIVRSGDAPAFLRLVVKPGVQGAAAAHAALEAALPDAEVDVKAVLGALPYGQLGIQITAAQAGLAGLSLAKRVRVGTVFPWGRRGRRAIRNRNTLQAGDVGRRFHGGGRGGGAGRVAVGSRRIAAAQPHHPAENHQRNEQQRAARVAGLTHRRTTTGAIGDIRADLQIAFSAGCGVHGVARCGNQAVRLHDLVGLLIFSQCDLNDIAGMPSKEGTW